MRQFFLVGVFGFSCTVVMGQTQRPSVADTTETIVETPAMFPGGMSNMYKIIDDNLHYPETAVRDNLGGKVLTQFVVDTLGNVVNIEILQGIREDLDNEAKRLIGLLNGWSPGTQGGKKVKVRYVMPLTFFPDNKWKRKYKRLAADK
jgi:TonB family protein